MTERCTQAWNLLSASGEDLRYEGSAVLTSEPAKGIAKEGCQSLCDAEPGSLCQRAYL